MVQETISYYEHNDINVYDLFIDVSKIFDQINYCKYFQDIKC